MSGPLFSENNDVIFFDDVTAGSYDAPVDPHQIDAMGGNDTVEMPSNETERVAAGLDADFTMLGGDGDATLLGGGLEDTLMGETGNDTVIQNYVARQTQNSPDKIYWKKPPEHGHHLVVNSSPFHGTWKPPAAQSLNVLKHGIFP